MASSMPGMNSFVSRQKSEYRRSQKGVMKYNFEVYTVKNAYGSL